MEEDYIYECLPQYEVDPSLDLSPTLDELQMAIKQMKNNKSPGVDGLPYEVYKYGGKIVITKIFELISLMWKNETIPSDFKESIISILFKGKGDKSDCNNYRGLSLTCTAGKIFGKIMSNRLRKFIDKFIPESQSAFRINRGTSDMIFSLRQLQEKCTEQNKEMHMIFIDIAKAYDSINRNLLWGFLRKFGCPPKFINILQKFHSNNNAMVKTNSGLSDPFTVTNGVKQGCVIAPYLFNVFMTAFLIIVDSKLITRGIGIKYRFDGGLHKLSRLKSKHFTAKKFISELQYADDILICAHSTKELQEMVDTFSQVYSLLGLKININKSKTLIHNQHHQYYPLIKINNETIENVKSFKYLGSFISDNGNLTPEIQNRIRNSSAAIAKLNERVFKNNDISMEVKLRVYKSIILPTLLYGCESWVLYRSQIKEIESYQQRILRNIMKINWFDYISNKNVLLRANCPSIETMITRTQMRWVGHVVRMENNRLPKCILYSELICGKRSKGGQKKRFKDCINVVVNNMGIANNWEILTENRANWRRIIHDQNIHQINMRQVAAANREILTCDVCNRLCLSRIGLFSHLRTHNLI